jgi:hypothetical protein
MAADAFSNPGVDGNDKSTAIPAHLFVGLAVPLGSIDQNRVIGMGIEEGVFASRIRADSLVWLTLSTTYKFNAWLWTSCPLKLEGTALAYV